MNIKNRRGQKRDHWLDYADDKFSRKFIDDVKQYLRVLLVFLAAPMFWALFDQQVCEIETFKIHVSIF